MPPRAGHGAGAVALTLLTLAGQAAAQRTPAQVEAAAASITSADFARHLAVLSDDSLRGRQTGTPGAESAARYIADQFRREGLDPLGGAEFVQPYTLRLSTLDVAGMRLVLSGRSGSRSLTYGADYMVMPSEHQSVRGEIVLAGEAPMIAEHLPPGLAGKIAAFYVPGGLSPEWNRRLAQCVREATEVGALGVLFVMDSAYAEAIFARFRPYAERERSGFEGLPQVGIGFGTAAELLRSVGVNPLLLKHLPAGAPPLGTGFQLELTQPLKVREMRLPNVVGVLPGRDRALRNEYVVLSAHFDHVGVGRPDARGDSIYNGSDDNASGTVALLEIAHAFRQKGVRPARPIIFLAVSGEEQGLRGSEAWVAKPPVPLASIVAEMNLDMVTRNSPDTVAVLGQELSTLGEVVRTVATTHPDLRLTVPAGNPWPQLDLLSMSDQLSFLRAGVPSVFLFTGLHEDLHQPTDELARSDVDKGTRVARLAFLTAHAVATASARPAWTEEGKRSFRH